jgi:hypothetical protein
LDYLLDLPDDDHPGQTIHVEGAGNLHKWLANCSRLAPKDGFHRTGRTYCPFFFLQLTFVCTDWIAGSRRH